MDASADKPHILVVDDDTRLRELLKTFLSRNGFRVSAASHAAEARQRLAALDFDLMVLDVMMPGETGLEFAAELRRTDDVPILMLTAMGEPKDRIAGLEKGVDDYLGKPFEPRELLLRIQNVLRRETSQRRSGAESARQATFGPYQFDRELGELTQKGKRVPLTDAEVALLRALTGPPGRGAEPRDAEQERRRCRSTNAPSTCRSRGSAARSSPTRPSRATCAPFAARAIGWSTHEARRAPTKSSSASPALPTGIRRRPCSRAR